MLIQYIIYSGMLRYLFCSSIILYETNETVIVHSSYSNNVSQNKILEFHYLLSIIYPIHDIMHDILQ